MSPSPRARQLCSPRRAKRTTRPACHRRSRTSAHSVPRNDSTPESAEPIAARCSTSKTAPHPPTLCRRECPASLRPADARRPTPARPANERTTILTKSSASPTVASAAARFDRLQFDRFALLQLQASHYPFFLSTVGDMFRFVSRFGVSHGSHAEPRATPKRHMELGEETSSNVLSI